MNTSEKKRLLIFAHYYFPDVASTGQILQELAEGMLDTFEVTVICVVPSYGGVIAPEYKTKKYYQENINGVSVLRVRVPDFVKGNKLSRVKNIVAYFFRALLVAKKAGKQDYVFTISQPPILGGLLGVFGKWLKHAKMIYCIQDFNPEQILAVGYSKNKLVLGLMMWLDKFSCRHSDLVVTVGRDLVETLKKRFRGKKVPNHVMINNWVDEKKIYPLPDDNARVLAFRKQYSLEEKFVFMYSGNLGLYYDLENFLEVIRSFKPGTTTPDGKEVVFAFVGDGSLKEKMVKYKEEHHMDNVVFIPYQKKDELVYSLNVGDVHCCLNAKGMKGVSCPSKFYGIVTVGKPILGSLEKDTEIRVLLERIDCGICSDPGDYGKLEQHIQWFVNNSINSNLVKMGQKGRTFLVENLARSQSLRRYIEEILNIGHN